jgi:asparagine synthase (glutamine-hydrolysing)
MRAPDAAGDFLSIGSPVFRDPALARLVRDEGPAAAWAVALRQGPLQAAAGVAGHFAVGLREPSGRSFAAVDRFAMHTLCYRVEDGRLRFAARADTLAGRNAAIDPQAIYDYLHFHMIPSPRTVFEGVFRLPPGHCAVVEHGRLTVAPYWVPSFEPDRTASVEVLSEEFRRLLRAAVERSLDGGAAACFLSGGTDSSTVAGMAAAITGAAPSTYSIGFEAEGYDEMHYARIAARHFKTRHHEYYVTPDDLVRGVPQMAAHVDQPFGNSSVLPAFCCAERAREDGVALMLAGDGGDELFGGNARYATQRLFDWYQHLPASLRGGLLEPLLARPGMRRVPVLRKAASYVATARTPMPDRMEPYNLLERLGPHTVLTEDFLSRVDRGEPQRRQREVWAAANADSPLDRTLAFDWRYTLAENDLPKVRAATELAGVSAGFPLLDDDLVAFSQRLPSEYKVRGLTLRWFFKHALRDFLPAEILRKKKHGFGLPFGIWLVRHAGLRSLAADSLHGLADRGIVRRAFVQELLGPKLDEHPAYYGEMVWILTMLEQWMRRHAPHP